MHNDSYPLVRGASIAKAMREVNYTLHPLSRIWLSVGCQSSR
ncbi:hypothetical protein LTSESEN_5920 [Salmonella enterica subsp. enterica serovar Senftenberg str. A4-543]|uniref:Uncharacterized protein n=1 Tax=Salmonella enterica subsp. enterica serovar Senftenberg str. A4-543 TaxID=913082 RepID=G5R829_SALSE|nr:hypothetical protein LTSESEN_5920 [Salmonella enterica subsp. enterica serovar Senftenberg str. A4-543]